MSSQRTEHEPEDVVQGVLKRVEKRTVSEKKVFLAVENEDGEVDRVSHKFQFPGTYALVREEFEE